MYAQDFISFTKEVTGKNIEKQCKLKYLLNNGGTFFTPQNTFHDAPQKINWISFDLKVVSCCRKKLHNANKITL